MTDRHTLGRRTVLGIVAGAGLGTLGSGSAHTADGMREGALVTSADVESDDVDLEAYANRVGRITQEGVSNAFDDWANGDITTEQLDIVIDAWADGDRVLDEGLFVVPLDSDIEEDTILEREPDGMPSGDQVVYQVQSDIRVDAALTIEAGVGIEFQQGTEFEVADGTIVGEGTEEATILMTGTLAARRWWDGVRIRNDDLENELSHTIIEYGGGRNGCLDLASRLSSDVGLIELTNCTLRRSGAYGLYLDSGGELASGSGGNTYTKNRQGAAYARTNNLHTLSGDSTYVGNDTDAEFVRVVSNSLEGEDSDESHVEWEALDVPYRMADGRHSVDDIELEIAAGATFEFTQTAYARLRSGSRLTFVGTEAEPITFTGTDKQRGWWDGLEIETGDIENVMEYVVVEYGGNDLPGNITLADRLSGHEVDLQLEHCTFRQSAGFGMYADTDVELHTTENTYTGNAAGAARIPTESMHMLSESSTFQGNDNDYVLVSPSGIEGAGAGETQVTWDALDVPYRMQDDRHDIDNLELVIDPGATFEFSEGARLRIRSGTRMTWSGFDEDGGEEGEVNEITFTGVEEQRGWWDGIQVETGDSNNLMEFVIVEYGGNDLDGNVSFADRLSGHEVDLLMENCTFRQSGAFGMYAGSDVELETFSNVYTENAAGAANIRTENVHMLSQFSTFQGNDNDYVLVRDQTLDEDWGQEVTWNGIDVPYRMDGGRHDIDDINLYIDPGATFEFTEGARIRLRSGCSIIMDGTQDDPITFTGTNQQPGWWDGIEFETGSLLNEMSYVTVEHAGDDLPANITFADRLGSHSAYLEMEHCTLAHSGAHGMYLDSDVELVLSANLYTGNEAAPAALPAENAHELSASSSFTGNADDTIEVRGSSINSSSGSEIVWDSIDVPYRITGDVDVDEVTFGIEPGTAVHFEEDIEFEFDTDSVIDIHGTVDEPVAFRATAVGQDIQGWWRGILVESGSLLNEMSHVVVENGGRDPDSTPEGNVHINSSGTLELVDSALNDSGSAGVYVEEGANVNGDICSVNEFENNAGGDCIVN